MSYRFWHRLVIAGVMAAMVSPAFADEQTFSNLLARAEEQAAAGHRWAPPGDNMTETVADMMGLIYTATPEQLAKLATLLEEPHPASESDPAPDRPAGSPSMASDQPAVPPLIQPVVPPPVPPKEQAGLSASPSAVTQEHSSVPGVSPAQRNEGPSPELKSASNAAQVSPPALAGPVTSPSFIAPEAPKPPPATTALASARPAQPVIPAVPSIAPRPLDATAEYPAGAMRAPGQTVLRPNPHAQDLLNRGQQAERQGDVSGARRFYASAAQQGNATAARYLGRLYDPAYLKQTALGGIDPNPDLARRLYEQAITMGDTEARPLLEALSVR